MVDVAQGIGTIGYSVLHHFPEKIGRFCRHFPTQADPLAPDLTERQSKLAVIYLTVEHLSDLTRNAVRVENQIPAFCRHNSALRGLTTMKDLCPF